MVGGEVVAGLGIPAGGGYFNGIVALEAEVLGGQREVLLVEGEVGAEEQAALRSEVG